MAGPLLYPPTQEGLQKTLGAALDEGDTSSMTLNNTTGVQNLPGVAVINRIDTDGNEKSASLREYIRFTAVSGSTLTGLTRGRGGSTDQDHANGSVVEFILDVDWGQAVIDALANLVDTTTLAIDTTKIVTPTGSQTLTNKTINSATLATVSMLGDPQIEATANIQPGGSDPSRLIIYKGAAMTAHVSLPAESSTVITVTNGVNFTTKDFDSATAEKVFVSHQMANSWDGGGIKFKVEGDFPSGASGTSVAFGLRGRSFADGEALDQALGTEVLISLPIVQDIGDVVISGLSAFVTLSGTPAGGESVYLELTRKVSDGNDTMVGDFRVKNLIVQYVQKQYAE